MDDKNLQKFAQRKLDEIYQDSEPERLYASLLELDRDFAKVAQDQFKKEWICARMAFATICWSRSGESHALSPAQTKLLLRKVTESFQSPKMLEIAAGFSEYYYATDLVDEAVPSIAVTKRLIERLKISKPDPGSQSSPVLIKQLIEIFESLRASLENEFSAVIDEVSFGGSQ